MINLLYLKDYQLIDGFFWVEKKLDILYNMVVSFKEAIYYASYFIKRC